MPHVLEGQLHAYLDGALAPSDPQFAEIEAHLAGCADCRARLEHERLAPCLSRRGCGRHGAFLVHTGVPSAGTGSR